MRTILNILTSNTGRTILISAVLIAVLATFGVRMNRAAEAVQSPVVALLLVGNPVATSNPIPVLISGLRVSHRYLKESLMYETGNENTEAI